MTNKQLKILEILYNYSASQFFMTQSQLIDMINLLEIIKSRSYAREQLDILEEQKYIKREALPGTRYNLVSLRRSALLLLSDGKISKAKAKTDPAIRNNIYRTQLIIWELETKPMRDVERRTSFLTGTSFDDVLRLYGTILLRYPGQTNLENIKNHIQILETQKKNYTLVLKGEKSIFKMDDEKTLFSLINKNKVHFSITKISEEFHIKCSLIPEIVLTVSRIERICKLCDKIFRSIFRGSATFELDIICGSTEIAREIQNKVNLVASIYEVKVKETDLQKYL